MSRKIKVPAENRIAASVPARITVSSSKYLTCTDSFEEMADSVALSGLVVDFFQAVSDSFTLTDTRAIALGLTISVDDVVVLYDYVSISLVEGVSDSLSQSDALQMRVGHHLASADNFILTDDLTLFSFGFSTLNLSDSHPITDSLVIGYGLAPSESFTLTDSLATFAQIFLTINDSGFQWDDFIAPVPQGVAFSVQRQDALSQADAIQLFAAGFMTQAESINNLFDVYFARSQGFTSFSESLFQFDALAVILHYRLNLSDSITTLVDGVVGTGSIWDVTVFNQQTTQADAFTQTTQNIGLTATLSDIMGTLADAIVAKTPRWRDAIATSTVKTTRWRDAISVQSNASFQALTISLSDSQTLTDAISIARAQWAAPISDVSVGLWSSTPLWQKVDEPAFNDADFIVSATNPSNDTCELLFRAMTDPVSSVNHVLSYRIQKSAGGGRQIDLTISLRQGSTQIASWTKTNITNAVVAYNETLTTAQADAITNYADLRVRFVAVFVGTGTGRAARVTWAQFRCPK